MPPSRLALPSPRRAAIIYLLAAGNVWALAKVEVTLGPPSAPLEAGRCYWIQPTVAGAGGKTQCWYAVTRNDRLVVAPDSPLLTPRKGGGVVLSLGADWEGEFLLRATSRADPSAFAVVPFQVVPQGKFPAAGTAPETKGGPDTEPAPWTPVPQPAAAPGAAEGPAPRPYVWATHFQMPFSYPDGEPEIYLMAWDRFAPVPAILALCRRRGRYERPTLVRLGLDGSGTVLLSTDPEVAKRFEVIHLDEILLNSVDLRTTGEILLTGGTAPPRIYQLSRDGKELKVVAGTGKDGSGRLAHEHGQPRLATEVDLEEIGPLAVAPDNEIVFCGRGGVICGITPQGRMEALAGDGKAVTSGLLDLRRRHPATAGSMDFVNCLAAADDGRILACGRDGYLELFPDGTLKKLATVESVAGSSIGLGIAASTTHEVYSWIYSNVYKIHANGRSEALLDGALHHDTPPIAPATPAERFAPGEIRQVTRAPGGGMWILGRGNRIVYLGPGRGEAALARQVDQAADAAHRGDRRRYDEIRAALLEWTSDPDQAYRDRVLAPALGKQNPAIPRGPQKELGARAQDTWGLAYRAQLALDAIAARTAHLPQGWLSRSATGSSNLWTSTLSPGTKTFLTRIDPCAGGQVFEARCLVHTENLTRGAVELGFVFLDTPSGDTPPRRQPVNQPVDGLPMATKAAGPVQLAARGIAPEDASRVQFVVQLTDANPGARARIESIRLTMPPPEDAAAGDTKAAPPELWVTELAAGAPGASAVKARYQPCVEGEAFQGLCQARAEGPDAQARLGMVFQRVSPGGLAQDLAVAKAPEGAADRTGSSDWTPLAVRGKAPRGANRVKFFLQSQEADPGAKAGFRSVDFRLLPPEPLAETVAAALDSKGTPAAPAAAGEETGSSSVDEID